MLKKNKLKIFIQAIYAAPYRVGVFEELSKKYDVIVFFEQKQGDNRNSKFFKNNNNNLNSYYIEDNKELYNKTLANLKEYSIVFVYDYSSKLSMHLMQKCIKNKVPYFINCDGYIPNKKNIKYYLKRVIKKYFITHAERLLANGECSKKYFLENGAKEEKIDIHNFSSLYKKDIKKEIILNKNKLKKELGLNTNRLYISVGRFEYLKGFDLLINSIIELKDAKSQYVIIGGGLLKEDFNNLIKENNLKNVKLIDFLEKEELLKYYAAADAFIFPTRSDIWGLVINEAMSFGLPVISTDRCAAALEMVNASNGIIVKSDSIISLKQAIQKFNQYSEQELQLMGKNSLKIAQKYNIEDIAKCHEKSINKVIEQ